MEDMKFESLMPAPKAREKQQQLETNVKVIADEMIGLLKGHDTENIDLLLQKPQALLKGLKRSELKKKLDQLRNDAVSTDLHNELYTRFYKLQPTRYLYNSLECYKKYMEFIDKAVEKSTECPVTLHIASAPPLSNKLLHDIVTRVIKGDNLKVIYHFRYNAKIKGTYFRQVMDEVFSDKTKQDLAMRKYFRKNEKHEIRLYFCHDGTISMNVDSLHTQIEDMKKFTEKKAKNVKVWYYFKEIEFNKMMQVINGKKMRRNFADGTSAQWNYLKEYFDRDTNHRIILVEDEAQYYFHTKWAAYSAAPDQRVKLLLTSANLINDHLESTVEDSRILNSMIEGTLPYQDFQARFLTPMTDGYETVMRPVTMSGDSINRLRPNCPAGNYNDVQIYQQVKEFVEEAVLKSTTNPCVLHIVSPYVDYAKINQIIRWSSTALSSGKLQLNVTYKRGNLKELEAAIKTASAIDSLQDFINVLNDLKTPKGSQDIDKSQTSGMKLLCLDTEQEDNIMLLKSVKVTHVSDFHCKFIGYGPQASADESAGIHEKSDDESAGLTAAGSAAARSAAGPEAEAESEAGIYEVLMMSANFTRRHMNASKEERKNVPGYTMTASKEESENAPGYANLEWTVRLKLTEQDWKFMIGLIED